MTVGKKGSCWVCCLDATTSKCLVVQEPHVLLHHPSSRNPYPGTLPVTQRGGDPREECPALLFLCAGVRSTHCQAISPAAGQKWPASSEVLGPWPSCLLPAVGLKQRGLCPMRALLQLPAHQQTLRRLLAMPAFNLMASMLAAQQGCSPIL